MSAWTIVAYQFRADEFCPEHILEEVRKALPEATSPGLLELEAEHGLDQVAEYLGIDRMEERTFDSGDFPKVCFESDMEPFEDGTPRTCSNCGKEIS